MFLKQQWYVAAMPGEVNRAPLGRIICGEAVVMFRREDGAVVALQDQCPHRKYALSKGRVEGSEIVCLYHGLKFNGEGRCTFIPGQDRIPDTLKARVYPTCEKFGWVWIWMGVTALGTDDATQADESHIPDFSLHDAPGWQSVWGYLRIEGDYRIVLDNFLDLTHIGYVHVATIGNAPAATVPMQVEPGESDVKFTRFMVDVPPPPTFLKAVPFPGNVDRWQKARFLPPSNFQNDIRAVPTGTEDESRGLHYVVNNSLTPETETSTHYFWSVPRNYNLDDDNTSQVLRGEMIRAFEEDKAVIEIQQKMMDMESPRTPINPIKADAAALAMRRVLERLEREEKTQASA
ncbi:MAG: aromatic ring-hydroxylating dioxygenase subunit alpha [Betaproteobacteria bacterium]|nr:aromatic ring-hydroxylating dioxygenase subunit alpha [Betaproteobacteria bacterium]